MTRSGGSLAGILAVGAALVVALLAGPSAGDDSSAAPPAATRIRIGVYDPRAIPRCPEAAPAATLAAIARRADLAAITARTDFHADRVELVDVTGEVAAALRLEEGGAEEGK